MPTTNNPRADLTANGSTGYIHYGDIHLHDRAYLDPSDDGLPTIDRAKCGRAASVRNGDMIVVDASEDPEGIAKSVEVRMADDRPVVAGLHTFLLRDEGNAFAPGFRGLLRHVPAVDRQLVRLATGMKVFGVNSRALRTVQVPVPPKPEQERIVEALGDADAAIAALDRVIAKKRAVRRGTMQALLSGRTRLPGFGGRWMSKQMSDLAIPNPSSVRDSYATGSHVSYVALENAKAGQLHGFERVLVEKAPSRAQRGVRLGDTLFGTVRPNLRSHLCWKFDLHQPIVSTGFCVLRPIREAANPTFLYYSIYGREIDRQTNEIIAGSNYPAVSSPEIAAMSISVPPSVEEQAAIGSVIADMDVELDTLSAKLAKLRAVKTGMMQELLSGRTRLV